MKKKKWIIIGIIVILVFLVCGIILVSQSPKWSEMSFEAIVKETVIQPDGESRLIVERSVIHEIYGSTSCVAPAAHHIVKTNGIRNWTEKPLTVINATISLTTELNGKELKSV